MQSLHEGVLGSTSTHKDTTHHKACEDRIISAVIIYQRPPLFVKLVIMDMGGEGGGNNINIIHCGSASVCPGSRDRTDDQDIYTQ